MKHFNNAGVELISVTEALVEAEASKRLGYKSNTNYTGTAVYNYVNYKTKNLKVQGLVGNVKFYTASTIRKFVTDYIELHTAPKISGHTVRQVNTLLEKAKSDPAVAKYLVQVLTKVA